ncbi:MAG: hypothetical protein AAFP77_19770 [Bacteroidota bacterium]
MSDYKAPIRGIWAVITKLLSQLLGLFVPSIKDDEQRLIVSGVLNATKETIEVLSDADPNDKEQMRGVLNRLFNDGPFKEGAKAELMQKINEITNSNVRVVLSVINNQVYPVLDLLTDQDRANDEQLEELLREQLRGEDGILLIRAIFGLFINNSQFADTAAVLVLQLLLTQLEEEGGNNTDFASQVVALQSIFEQRSIAA